MNSDNDVDAHKEELPNVYKRTVQTFLHTRTFHFVSIHFRRSVLMAATFLARLCGGPKNAPTNARIRHAENVIAHSAQPHSQKKGSASAKVH